jgi:hypothetical protein
MKRAAILVVLLSLAIGTDASTNDRNIFGIWSMRFDSAPPKGAPPYNEHYLPSYQASSALVESGKLDLGGQCLPPGMPRVTSYVGQFEILAAPKGRITILHEYQTQQRRIYLTAKQPDYLNPAPNGYSTGRWEGKKLVVQTTAIDKYVYLDENAGPHSDELKVTERFRLVSPNVMVIDTTVEDPVVLIAPWKYSRTYDRTSNELIDYECNENPRNPVNADGSLGYTFKSSQQ